MNSIKISNFKFFVDPPWDERKVFRALIPSSIKSSDELFKYYASLLQIGGYFGHNWMALDEVLKHFEWIDDLEVEIIHDGLPTLESKDDLKYYLGMLSGAIDFWDNEGVSSFIPGREIRHKLKVYFPNECKEKIKNLA